MLENLTILDFEAYLNKSISIRFTPEVILPAELISAVAWGEKSDKYRQPFTLVFRTPQKQEYYQQGTFILLHPEPASCPFFLCPLEPDSEGMRYEAVFT